MPLDVTKIHQGPGKLFAQCQIPTSGNRLLIDINGNPTQGSALFVGATEGAVTLGLAPKLELIGADQVSSPIDVVATADDYEVDVEVKQSDLNLLRQFFTLANYTTGTDAGLPAGVQNYEEITFGGIASIPKQCIALVSPRRDAATKFIVSVLYQCFQAEAIKLPFARAKATLYKVKFTGLADPTRAVGDQVGSVYRQL